MALELNAVAFTVANKLNFRQSLAPTPSIGTLIAYAVQQELARWWTMSIRGRAAQIIGGGRRDVWTPPAGFDISKAVVPATLDGAGLSAAIVAAAARSTNRTVLVNGDIALAANCTPASVGTQAQPITIISTAGATISGNFALVLRSYTDVIGLTINGAHLFADTPTGYTGIRVIGNLFTNCGTMGATSPYATGGIGDGTTSDNTDHTGWRVELNEFIDCEYATYSQRLDDSWIRFNRVRQTTTNYTRRGIWIVGGNNNRIEHNWVSGGRVGIAFLADRSLTKSVCNNTFAYNVVTDCNEEGLSIDGYGNDGSKCAVVDRLTVASTTGTISSSPRLVCNRSLTPANAGINGAGNHAIQVISGSLAGRYWRIVGAGEQSANTSVYLQLENNSISTAEFAALVGAKITVVIHCANNTFHGNVVRNTQTPVMLWGMGHRTTITNNWLQASGTGVAGANGSNPFGVSAAIGIWGIGIPAGGTAPTNGTAGNAYLCLPSMCTVQGNYVEGGGIVIGGLSWENQTNVEAAMDPIPHYIGGNNVNATTEAWRSGSSVTTLFSESVGTVTAIGGTFDAGALTLESTFNLPAAN